MSQGNGAVGNGPADDEREDLDEFEEDEELNVELTDDNYIALSGSDWEVFLTAEGARELASVLLELADEATADDEDEPE